MATVRNRNNWHFYKLQLTSPRSAPEIIESHTLEQVPQVLRQLKKWKEFEAVLLKHHHNPDLEAARTVASAPAAHFLSGPPVWLMMVAPPGSMKTELLSGLDGFPEVLLLDKLTPNTFLSGQIDEPGKPRKTAASLLHRIGPSGIIIYPDFSTVLSMHRESRASVLADMRRIYDGRLHKEVGTAEHPEERDWRGRITFIVAATPDVDRHYSIFQTLGERFVMVRWDRPGGVEAALKAMNQNQAEAREDLRRAFQGLLSALPRIEPELRTDLQRRIAALAEFAVRARTHVPRSYGKEIIYVPEPEAATRLAQQLAQLAKGSALLAGRTTAGGEDLAVARRAALDSIPKNKRQILDALISGQGLGDVKLPASTLHYAAEDLESEGLLENGGGLSGLARDLLGQAGLL